MSDIVERLEKAAAQDKFDNGRRLKLEAAAEIGQLRDDSRMLALCEGDRKMMADEIERLRDRIAGLETALLLRGYARAAMDPKP